jgi:hypothetical protein
MRDVVRAVMGTDANHHTPMAVHMSRRMHIIVAGSHTNTLTGRTRAPTRVPMCARAAMLIPRAPTPIHHRATMDRGLRTRCLNHRSCNL